jgi:two-component system KDP operon response regulator KdpE
MAGRTVHLTRTEFEILATLARHPGSVLTQEQLTEEVWGPGYHVDAQTLRVHVGNLRKKIEPKPSEPAYVINYPGVGYRLSGEDGRRQKF